MHLLELTCPRLEENLALDEALLEDAERSPGPKQWLRIWESPEPAVVIGRASRVADEVNLEACLAQGVPVGRRCSGGAAVVLGRGCLMYAVVLDCRLRPELRAVDVAHRFVLSRNAEALRRRVPGVRCQGISDLTLDGRKFSGNSLRVKRDHLLYHGSLLYDFPLDAIEGLLRAPPRQPAYRAGRPHGQFVRNLALSAEAIRDALLEAWQPDGPAADWPVQRVQELAETKYARREWNHRL